MNCINFQKPYIGFQKNYIAPIVNHRLSQSAYQVISEVVKIIAAKIFLDFLSKVVIGEVSPVLRDRIWPVLILAPVIEEIIFRGILLKGIKLIQGSDDQLSKKDKKSRQLFR